MKKIIIFVIITTFVVWVMIETDWCTYLNGKLQPIPSLIFFVVMSVLFIVALLYLISGKVKRYVEKEKMVDFVQE